MALYFTLPSFEIRISQRRIAFRCTLRKLASREARNYPKERSMPVPLCSPFLFPLLFFFFALFFLRLISFFLVRSKRKGFFVASYQAKTYAWLYDFDTPFDRLRGFEIRENAPTLLSHRVLFLFQRCGYRGISWNEPIGSRNFFIAVSTRSYIIRCKCVQRQNLGSFFTSISQICVLYSFIKKYLEILLKFFISTKHVLTPNV